MRRIEFIAPVESVRGNMSGTQVLQYAENNNPAFYAPAGRKVYARNYTTRYIGAKRASDGRKYFSVRTKNAVNMTPAALNAMALLGGEGALFGAIMANKTTELYANLYAQYVELYSVSGGLIGSFRKSLGGAIRTALVNKAAQITYSGPRGVVQFVNPWSGTTQTPGATISNAILAKFWKQLADNNPIVFTVNGQVGLAQSGFNFDDLIGTDYNILGLTLAYIGETNYIKMGSLFVLNPDGDYATELEDIISEGKYTTTNVSPA